MQINVLLMTAGDTAVRIVIDNRMALVHRCFTVQIFQGLGLEPNLEKRGDVLKGAGVIGMAVFAVNDMDGQQ